MKITKDDIIDSSLPKGFHLGNYIIDKILGQGGFGVTYKAKDLNSGNLVVIKEHFLQDNFYRVKNSYTVVPKMTSDQGPIDTGIDSFLREAETLATFNHPNIVQIIDYFEALGTAYLVMPFWEGRTLAQVIVDDRKGVMTLKQKVNWLPGILRGLKALHSQGYLHRDIKPENIFFKTNGEPMLIDFGASRNALAARSKSLSVILTPGYSPLEQYSSKANVQGPWTDIYSLGASLYFCLAGVAPVSSLDRQAAIMENEPDPLDKELDELCQKQRIPLVLKAALVGSLRLTRTNRIQGVKEFYLTLNGEKNESARQAENIRPEALGTPIIASEELKPVASPSAPLVNLETRVPNSVPPPSPQTPAGTPEKLRVIQPLLQPKPTRKPSPSSSAHEEKVEEERYLPKYFYVSSSSGKPKFFGVIQLALFYLVARMYLYISIVDKITDGYGEIFELIKFTTINEDYVVGFMSLSIFLYIITILLFICKSINCNAFNDLNFLLYLAEISCCIIYVPDYILESILIILIAIVIDIIFYLLIVIYMHVSQQVAYTFGDYKADPRIEYKKGW
ncbi:MAG: serine/threonine protein kinase [Deltaproteobacteria bacterium]|jgi:serine/threonine protein kinase|nr:serine/threonine protein kinase [Deltaproteobacteria bacterium]